MKIYYLYIKESILGLKYLGFTSQDPFLYGGSGKYWRLHIKKHNIKSFQIKTDILIKTNNIDMIKFWGLYYSKLYNVVESDDWANLMPESGESVCLGRIVSDEQKFKMSKIMAGKGLGKTLSLETKIKIAAKSRLLKHTNEAKIKIGISKLGNKYCLGRKLTNENKQKLIIANTGRILSKDSKDRISKAKRGKLNLKKRIPIIQLDSFDNVIKEWDSATIAANELSIVRANIIRVLKGRTRIAGGYKWKYKIENNIKMIDDKIKEFAK